jgi:aspartyl-tRNA(Asn)/glutamyl-tRNA(Gln) amidotransferase subunit C
MLITTSEVEQIAALARLELEEAELAAMAKDLGSIIDHIRELEGVDTAGVVPMGGVGDEPAPMRADEPGADPLHLPLERLAPALEEGLFLVPRLAALDADALLESGGSA